MFPPLPSVLVGGPTLPISGSSIWSVAVPIGVHKHSQTSSQVGTSQGDTLVGLLRRFTNRRKGPHNFQQTYQNGARQTTRSWLHRKDRQVDTHAHTTNSTPRFHDRYIHNDLDSTNQQDTGLTTGSKSTTSVRQVQCTPAFFIHREGTSINNGSVSGTFENTISHASKDPSLPHGP